MQQLAIIPPSEDLAQIQILRIAPRRWSYIISQLVSQVLQIALLAAYLRQFEPKPAPTNSLQNHEEEARNEIAYQPEKARRATTEELAAHPIEALNLLKSKERGSAPSRGGNDA